jgi:hypothetical protein
MKSFEQIYSEVHAKKFGKSAQPVPARSEDLAKAIGEAAATSKPKQQTETKPAKMIECPSCKEHFALSEDAWETAEEAAATGDSDENEDQEDPDNGDSDDLNTPAWDNAASTGLSWRTRKATTSERRSLKRD